ncbi:hypothetical protein [Marinobacter salexigens]|uniref:Uncharacterized protein n=1 Tax=Marinobacter salexigens TaxID=1925763 RepID=A0ABS6A5Z9_9GAMM|nr:hypothetical protein [Marinobacter salexigens]MBU2873464.1 hypothetical protein [Marinobacter salexigens]
MNKSFLIAWSYASEALLATLALGFLLLFYDAAQIANFLKPVAKDIAAYFSSVMFAASVAFLWTFYSKSDTPFSKWLYEKGAFTVYLTAYIVAVAIYALLFILLLVASKSSNVFFLVFTVWVLLIGIVNVYTFVRNVVGQLLLNMEFNRKHDK